MARPPRIEYNGAVYHVTARGNERREIFREDKDREMFLSTLKDAVGLHGLKVFGYRLMANHYHLLLETPLGNLSRAMGWVQATSTIRFNRNPRRSDHLFQSRRVPFPLINGYRFRNTAGVAERLFRKNLNHIHTEPLKRKIVKRLVERESIPWQIWL